MVLPRAAVGFALALVACGDPARAPDPWADASCPSEPAGLAWTADGTEPIVGTGSAYVVGDRVLVRGERPAETGDYDVASARVDLLPDAPALFAGATSAIDDAGAWLYVLGGHDPTADMFAVDHEASFFALDVARSVWEVATSLPQARAGAGVVVDGTSLLVFGGDWTTYSGASSLVLRYDLAQGATGAWADFDAMPEPRTRALVVRRDRHVLVVGGDYGNLGQGGVPLAASTLDYDLDAKAWRTLPGLAVPRRRAAGAWLCGRLIVAGGEDGDGVPLAAVEIFDPATETWTRAADLPEARTGLALVAWRGRLVTLASATDFGTPAARLVGTWATP